ncbi:short chain dehydrogenase [Truncatella angustata]|uniref:Short chain dehydrogenase n=1 Tax=Truncatella angustata TaxID=152316 RepID=A0A9P8RJ27_9PEZI|nr:short chain dehydrogenase [Truncatella angustata]KAH6645031.1 short chain dehydrogenase [Truncatella angustata]
MAEFQIKDQDLTSVEGKVVVLTGGSSGIGLATVELLLSLGASVVSGDIQAPAEKPSGAFTFVKTDVTKWSDLVALFKQAKETYGRIDAVFANAGLGPRADYLSTEVDENGDLKEPTYALFDVSLKGVINTATLAIFYLRQQAEGGSIVINGSSTGLQRVRAVDYSTAKHGTLGLGRSLTALTSAAGLPIRVNTLTPTWTDSQVLPNLKGLLAAINVDLQPASVVARAAALMIADKSRHGNVIYIERGTYKEIDDAVLLPAHANQIIGEGYPFEDDVLARVQALG